MIGYNILVKKKLLILLIFIAFLDLFKFGLKLVPHFLIILMVSYLTDYLLIKMRKLPPFFPLAALDTALIISFVLDPSSSILYKFIVPIIAISSKHFVNSGENHIFNPAGFGLFVGALIGASISWWIGGSGLLVDLILIAGMVYILKSTKRLRIILSFFVAFFVLRVVLFQELNFWFSLMFFPFVMLPEPMTSPGNIKQQIIYGSIGAILLSFFRSSGLVFVDSFLQTLLLVNILYKYNVLEKIIKTFSL